MEEKQDSISIVWHKRDVLWLDSSLNDKQVRAVLQQAKHNHDAEIGVTWDVLRAHIDNVKRMSDDELERISLISSKDSVSFVWHVDDVLEVAPDLTKEQAFEVLERARYQQNAEVGINWDVLRFHADDLKKDLNKLKQKM